MTTNQFHLIKEIQHEEDHRRRPHPGRPRDRRHVRRQELHRLTARQAKSLCLPRIGFWSASRGESKHCNEKTPVAWPARYFTSPIGDVSNGFSFSHSERGTHMFDRLTRKIIAAVVIIVISDKMRTWAKK